MTETDDGIIHWQVTAPNSDDGPTRAKLAGRRRYEPTEEDVLAIGALNEDQRATVKSVRATLNWGTDRATGALKEFRARTSDEAPEDAPRSADPVPAERGTPEDPGAADAEQRLKEVPADQHRFPPQPLTKGEPCRERSHSPVIRGGGWVCEHAEHQVLE